MMYPTCHLELEGGVEFASSRPAKLPTGLMRKTFPYVASRCVSCETKICVYERSAKACIATKKSFMGTPLRLKQGSRLQISDLACKLGNSFEDQTGIDPVMDVPMFSGTGDTGEPWSIAGPACVNLSNSPSGSGCKIQLVGRSDIYKRIAEPLIFPSNIKSHPPARPLRASVNWQILSSKDFIFANSVTPSPGILQSNGFSIFRRFPTLGLEMYFEDGGPTTSR
ncbi:hypothetical protein EDD16DRAFT_1226097 [Pisolithus croceorrhizus]|nr:hypothetical protein EDD16DRAFT_1226097 [Pisolithus croceorrhizus]KAI6147619.1 hypothetical protein EDD17DRAFT_76297 [Pisolithus thermaeus]